jgi:cytochrome P450
MTIEVPQSILTPPEGAVMAADHICIDLANASSYDDGVPYDAYEVLRREAPVAWHAEAPVPKVQGPMGGGFLDSPGFWAVTSHELVFEVSRTPQVFSSWAGGTGIPTSNEEALATTRQMLINMDAPEHSRLRRVLQPIFTPRAVQRLQDSIVEHSREIVEGVTADGGCEFVTSVASELPVRVLATLLGVPYEDRRLLFGWSNTLVGVDDPEYHLDPAALRTAIGEMFAYGKSIADARRAEPTDDIVSMIANAEVDGEALSDMEFSLFWLLLIIAGNETTRNTLSGGIIALHEHDRWRELRDDRALLPTAVDEIIRYVSPVIHFRRTALVDVVLGGQHVRAGDKVVVFYPAANRDPSVFDDPNALDLSRSPNPHLAFGVGPHFCLGSHLAKLQLSAMLNELLDRVPDLSLAGDVVRMRSHFINGIRELPVSFTAAA